MKKQLIFVVLVLIFTVVVLSGCEEQSEGYLDSRFFGTWEITKIGAYAKFASNGSYWVNTSGWLTNWWEVKDGKLCLGGIDASCRDFSFSEDGNTLTIHMDGGDVVYTKIES